ncbi:AEC family transporter [Methanocella sp. MCL-LM]|uniref:AEC family transporter n=1 Tax=Methanocella sp. MCL-LM TaxID=3412035 RepID=UPI003C744DFF
MSFIDVVVPIFGLMLIGWLLKAVGIFPEWLVRLVNDYVYYIGITVITFLSLHDTDKRLLFDPSIYLLNLLPMALIVVLALAAAYMLKLDRLAIPVVVTCAFFGNTGYIGFPLNASVQGIESLGLTAFISTFYTVIVFTFGAYLFRHYTREKSDDHASQDAGAGLKKMLTGLLKLPIIWATVLGLALSFVAIPDLVRLPMEWITFSTSPLALLATGAMISGSGFRENWKALGAISILKLAVMPAIVILMGIVSGVNGTIYRTSLLEAATPVGVTNAVIAEQYKADKTLASGAVVVSTLLFIVSLIVVLLFV